MARGGDSSRGCGCVGLLRAQHHTASMGKAPLASACVCHAGPGQGVPKARLTCEGSRKKTLYTDKLSRNLTGNTMGCPERSGSAKSRDMHATLSVPPSMTAVKHGMPLSASRSLASVPAAEPQSDQPGDFFASVIRSRGDSSDSLGCTGCQPSIFARCA